MINELSILLPILSLLLTVLVAAGGFFAYRHSYNSTASDVQEKVISALKAQNEAQEVQITTCEKEIARLKRVVSTIQIALKRRGLQIEIDNDAITLVDNQDRRSRTVRMSLDDDEEKEKSKAP